MFMMETFPRVGGACFILRNVQSCSISLGLVNPATIMLAWSAGDTPPVPKDFKEA